VREEEAVGTVEVKGSTDMWGIPRKGEEEPAGGVKNEHIKQSSCEGRLPGLKVFSKEEKKGPKENVRNQDIRRGTDRSSVGSPVQRVACPALIGCKTKPEKRANLNSKAKNGSDGEASKGM